MKIKQFARNLEASPSAFFPAWWLAGVSVLAGLFFLALSFSGGLLVSITLLDYGTSEKLFTLSERDLIGLMRLYAAFFLVLGALAGLLVWQRRVRIPGLWAKCVAFTVSSTTLLFVLLTRLGQEAPWYPLDRILTSPETLDVYGRRLLLVWPAQWLYQHVTGLTPLHTYYVIEAVTILVTMVLIGIWSARFAGWQNAYLGQLLLIVMISPTLSYHNYYDILIVGTFTAALLCLWDRRYVAFCAIVGIGTLNHENTLLLVFVAAAVCWERGTPRKIAAIIGGALAAYLIVKIGISLAVPTHAPFHHLRVITNLWELAHEPRAIGLSLAGLSTMCLCTVCGWNAASARLRRSAFFLIVPLFAVTYLFGKFREARQFDAFIPVAIAFALSALSQGTKAQNQPASDAIPESKRT